MINGTAKTSAASARCHCDHLHNLPLSLRTLPTFQLLHTALSEELSCMCRKEKERWISWWDSVSPLQCHVPNHQSFEVLTIFDILRLIATFIQVKNHRLAIREYRSRNALTKFLLNWPLNRPLKAHLMSAVSTNITLLLQRCKRGQ